MYRPKSLLAKNCRSIAALQRTVDEAIHTGATVITIRVTHRLPVPNRTLPRPPPSTPSLKWQEGHQP